MKKLLILPALFLIILSCGKDDITIYNNYEGNSSDSTGYFNLFYHDFEPDIPVGTADAINVNFNNDKEVDLRFSYSAVINKMVVGGHVITKAGCSEAIETPNNPEEAVANLDLEYLIQSTTDFHYYNFGALDQLHALTIPSCSPLSGDIYIGFKTEVDYTIKTTRNFGWIRVEIINPDSIILKDYAYNLIPNSPIRVGDK